MSKTGDENQLLVILTSEDHTPVADAKAKQIRAGQRFYIARVLWIASEAINGAINPLRHAPIHLRQRFLGPR